MSVVCCVISWVTDGDGDGLKFRDRIVVPFGCSTIGMIRCTPKAFFSEPEICLNFGTLNSANDRIRTKKAISNVAISANVAIQAGAPTGGHFGHSSSSCSSTSSSIASFISRSPGPILYRLTNRLLVRPLLTFPASLAAGWRQADPGCCAGTHLGQCCEALRLPFRDRSLHKRYSLQAL